MFLVVWQRLTSFIERTTCSGTFAQTEGNQTRSHGRIWFFSELMFLLSLAARWADDTSVFFLPLLHSSTNLFCSPDMPAWLWPWCQAGSLLSSWSKKHLMLKHLTVLVNKNKHVSFSYLWLKEFCFFQHCHVGPWAQKNLSGKQLFWQKMLEFLKTFSSPTFYYCWSFSWILKIS